MNEQTERIRAACPACGKTGSAYRDSRGRAWCETCARDALGRLDPHREGDLLARVWQALDLPEASA